MSGVPDEPVVPVEEHLERARERHEESAEEPDTYVAEDTTPPEASA